MMARHYGEFTLEERVELMHAVLAMSALIRQLHIANVPTRWEMQLMLKSICAFLPVEDYALCRCKDIDIGVSTDLSVRAFPRFSNKSVKVYANAQYQDRQYRKACATFISDELFPKAYEAAKAELEIKHLEQTKKGS